MSYSRGVLIHNFNEDQFGCDLNSNPRAPDAPQIAVSHLTHGWKQPSYQAGADPAATQGLDRHILFGHTGDMRDPHTNLQKTDFATAQSYFMQDPATITGVGHLSADGFTVSDDPKFVVKDRSVIALKAMARWGDGRQAHSQRPEDRFMTSSRLAAETMEATRTEEHKVERFVPESREFSQVRDQVRLLRTNFRSSGDSIRSAGQRIVR